MTDQQLEKLCRVVSKATWDRAPHAIRTLSFCACHDARRIRLGKPPIHGEDVEALVRLT